ncbi:hypothetical protein HYR99_21165 [Candidatus Poribacteria bacterium]|nr:hypothetical protein [Candidatus Poribacteria bacterium]
MITSDKCCRKEEAPSPFLVGAEIGAEPEGASEKIMLTEKKEEQIRKSIRSLEKQIDAHKDKLEKYKNNPDAYDNKGTLKNAPSEEIREEIIEGRIKKLEKEIRKFEKEKEKLEEELE